ncbi:MAG: glutamine synthetase family protein [Acidimicrobiales bacterium]
MSEPTPNPIGSSISLNAEVCERTVVHEVGAATALSQRLATDGVLVLRGTYVDSSGVYRAKQVPIGRAASFNESGLGASDSWAVFAADDMLCMTPSFSAVGDMRLRADLDAVVDLGDGIAWAPLDLVDQDGESKPFCPRQALRNQVTAARKRGISVLGATEVEFTLFDSVTNRPPNGQAYALSRLTRNEGFVDDLMASCEAAGVALEQFHAEYGPGQFELSVKPANPLAACDLNTLVRMLISRSARRFGYNVSFSPKPFFDSIGNGAHVHLSFLRDGIPLLSGGKGARGLTHEGERIVAGFVAALPEIVGALASSALSILRLQPGTWSGAYATWGLENREAAVRLCANTKGNPYGANVEIKAVDPSTNIYVAYAALIGTALDSLDVDRPLPVEATVDPGLMSEAERVQIGAVLIAPDHATVLARFEASALMRQALGSSLVEAIVAVRQHEQDLVNAQGIEAVAEMFQFAWSA